MKKILILISLLVPCALFAQLNENKNAARKQDCSVLLNALKAAEKSNRAEEAASAAHLFISNCLSKLNEDSLFSKANLSIIQQYSQNSNTAGFQLFYQHPLRVDKAMGVPMYAQNFVDFVVAKEEIDGELVVDGKEITTDPDWKRLKQTISAKYNKNIAIRTILGAQLRWYTYKKDTVNLIKYNVEKIEKLGLDTVGFAKPGLNNLVYYMIFRHSGDKIILRKAAGWMQILLKAEPENEVYMDTYANVLYKLGKIKEALIWEKKSLDLDPNNQETRFAWEQMSKGLPTWPIH